MPQTSFIKGMVMFLLIISYSCKKDELEIIKTEHPDKIVEGPFKDNNFLKFNNAPCVVDITNNTVYFSVKENLTSNFSATVSYDSFGDYDLEIDKIPIKNNAEYNFGNLNTKKPLQLKFRKKGKFENYKLIFTTLPIIEIYGNEEIKNYPKIPHRFKIHNADFISHNTPKQCTELVAGLEIRGSWSTQFEKKSFAVEFWKSFDNHLSIDASPFNLRNDDDWILDAMFVDRSKMRNKVSMELWGAINSLHYQEKEPNAKNYISGSFVEVFLNGKYHGLYHFTEKIDRKQLKLSEKANFADGGVLYKTENWEGPAFKNYLDFDNSNHLWNGFEQKYPDKDDYISWDFLYNGIKLVVDGDPRAINDDLSTYFEIDNLIDCFIMLNIIYGIDNTGKNMYFAKYAKNQPFFMVPWDMDATWGSNHNGENNIPYDGIASNNLYDTLIKLDPERYVSKLMSRWFELRKELIKPSNLTQRFRYYEKILANSGAIERENERWQHSYTEFEDQIDFIEEWIEKRIAFLDYYFYDVREKRAIN